MSTNFTRTLYDSNNQEMHNGAVRDANEWVMNSKLKEHDKSCFPNDGARHSQSEVSRSQNEDGTLNLGKHVNVESLLQNRHKEGSSFDRTNKDYAQVKLNTPKMCGTNKENMTNADTRLTHPILDYRGMYTADYKFTPYLHMNPQDVLVQNEDLIGPNRFGTSTRLDAKKNKKSKNKMDEFNNLVSNLLPKKK
jgi:hypothetical protein